MLKVNFVFYIYVLLEKLYRNTDRSVRKMILIIMLLRC